MDKHGVISVKTSKILVFALLGLLVFKIAAAADPSQAVIDKLSAINQRIEEGLRLGMI